MGVREIGSRRQRRKKNASRHRGQQETRRRGAQRESQDADLRIAPGSIIKKIKISEKGRGFPGGNKSEEPRRGSTGGAVGYENKLGGVKLLGFLGRPPGEAAVIGSGGGGVGGEEPAPPGFNSSRMLRGRRAAVHEDDKNG